MALGKALGGAATGGLKAAGGAAALGTGAFLRQAASPIPGGAAAMTAMLGITGAMASGAMKGYGGGNGKDKDPAAKQQSIGNEKLEELRTGIQSLIKINTEGFKDVRVMRGYMEDMRKLAYEEARNRLKKIQKPTKALPGAFSRGSGGMAGFGTGGRGGEDEGGGIPDWLKVLGGLALLKGLLNLLRGIARFPASLAEWIRTGWEKTRTRFSNMFKVMRGWGTSIGNWLTEKGTALKGEVLRRFRNFFGEGGTLRNWGASIGNWLVEKGTALKNNVLTRFRNFFGPNGTLRSWGLSINNWIVEKGSALKNNILTRFRSFFGSGGTLSTWATSIGSWLGEKGSALKGNIATRFKLFFGQGGTLSNWATQLDEFAKAKGSAFGNFISRLGGFFDDLIERIRAKIPIPKPPPVDDPPKVKIDPRRPTLSRHTSNMNAARNLKTSLAGNIEAERFNRAAQNLKTKVTPGMRVSTPPINAQSGLRVAAQNIANVADDVAPVVAPPASGPLSYLDKHSKTWDKINKWIKSSPAMNKIMGVAGKLGLPLMAIMTGWQVKNAFDHFDDPEHPDYQNKQRKHEKIGRAIGGGLGGIGMGMLGGAVGTAVGGPLGTIIGGFGGGIAGFFAGEYLGEQLIKAIYGGKVDKERFDLYHKQSAGMDAMEQYGEAMSNIHSVEDLRKAGLKGEAANKIFDRFQAMRLPQLKALAAEEGVELPQLIAASFTNDRLKGKIRAINKDVSEKMLFSARAEDAAIGESRDDGTGRIMKTLDPETGQLVPANQQNQSTVIEVAPYKEQKRSDHIFDAFGGPMGA